MSHQLQRLKPEFEAQSRRPEPDGELGAPDERIFLLPPEYKAASVRRSANGQAPTPDPELAHLRDEIKRLQSIIKFKDGVLLHVARYFEEVLEGNNPQSIGLLKRMVSQLKGAAAREQGGLE